MPLTELETYTPPATEESEEAEPYEFEVCYLCSGNTCRSPMAEAYHNHLRGRRAAISAGLCPRPGEPIAENAVRALRLAGIESTPENDYEHHRAVAIDGRTFLVARRICAMTGELAFRLILEFPMYADRITTFGEDIADPYLGGVGVYEDTLRQIMGFIQ